MSSHDSFHLYYLIVLGLLYFAYAFRERWISSRHDRETAQYIVENTLPAVYENMMSENVFWGIMHRSASPRGDLQEQIGNLTQALNNKSKLEIVAFDRRFQYYRDRLFRWDIWGAIYLWNGGCSSDAFADFRAWLIGQGKQKFEAVLTNPEAIVDFVKPGESWEGLQYCATKVYKEKTGDPLLVPFWRKDEVDPEELEELEKTEEGEDEYDEDGDLSWIGPRDTPRGEKWNEADLPVLFPNIARLVNR